MLQISFFNLAAIQNRARLNQIDCVNVRVLLLLYNSYPRRAMGVITLAISSLDHGKINILSGQPKKKNP